MIATVRGTVAHVGLDHLVVEMGGVGVRVLTTPATAAAFSAGDDAHLHTSLVVREESLTLYGFADGEALALFEQVQTVSGVGPRLAQAMLAVHDPLEVRRAISGGDVVALTKVPGIGRKGAERIVLELRDKVTPPALAHDAAPSAASTSQTGHPESGQVVEALVGLGWSTRQAEEAVRTVTEDPGPASSTGAAEVSGLLRAALRELGR
ncbi:MAG TPA: Holliday junction branch migration protein RuvA [Ornithinimicrobium sp.]|uniref:Holliday junction branch migration protein RuvA n=1 Tax=Ornithinimicrobium sp. TaxID=1977084 RepID=UPI002B49E3EB|nr:Holliday junction branch migration protein RuvA [Ornithinimicrobium sp.]HKJ11788.1 Holliday junction branch migration protein RuvA [Ornithinimicrobium sp.]